MSRPVKVRRPATAPRRSIEIANRHPQLKLDRRALKRAIHLLDEKFGEVSATAQTVANARVCPPGELSLVFLTDAALAQLHADFLDDPSATDVITFEGDAALGLAGEVCVSVDTARGYAKAHQRDFATELTLYVVHGWLHLAGFDDLLPGKKRVMRRAEARALRLLQENAARPKFSWRKGISS